jgi:hypothetical protein
MKSRTLNIISSSIVVGGCGSPSSSYLRQACNILEVVKDEYK